MMILFFIDSCYLYIYQKNLNASFYISNDYMWISRDTKI